MGIVTDKINELKKRIESLNDKEVCFLYDDYTSIIEDAQEIVKLATFLNEYQKLDAERERDVKETIQCWFEKEDMYDGTLLKCIGYCFHE